MEQIFLITLLSLFAPNPGSHPTRFCSNRILFITESLQVLSAISANAAGRCQAPLIMDFLIIYLAENGYLALMANAFNNTSDRRVYAIGPKA
jgi:hypothetical protein